MRTFKDFGVKTSKGCFVVVPSESSPVNHPPPLFHPRHCSVVWHSRALAGVIGIQSPDLNSILCGGICVEFVCPPCGHLGIELRELLMEK